LHTREYFLDHIPINFLFKDTSRDFVVAENPLYDFTGEGEHLILKVRKKELTTWELLDLIAKKLGINSKEIGYAGLKDKNGLTIQYLSINKKFEDKIVAFFENNQNSNIKLLEKTYHNNKIKLGHLKGNSFFVRLKKVNPTDASRIKSIVKQFKNYGIPNYFGFQRFGINGKNYKIGEEILKNKSKIRDRTKKKFFINAYQSYLFNKQLEERIKFSKLVGKFKNSELVEIFKELNYNFKSQDFEYLEKQNHPFKLLFGDVLNHYPHGKLFKFTQETLENDIKRFDEKDISPTGILVGNSKDLSRIADSDSGFFESKYHDTWQNLNSRERISGDRRYFWIFPTNIKTKYIENEFQFELSFDLPKGSYATTFLEELAHQNIN
jgi:tRNA pseudouridine13 synthase